MLETTPRLPRFRIPSAGRPSFFASRSTQTSVFMDDYQYQRLQLGNYIRYLVLEPGRGNDPIACSLHSTHIDGEPFEAISYVWGTSPRDQEISCGGKRLLITPNLQQALRHIRLPTERRKIWADSICINQEDPNERGHQVSLMDQVYSKARQVLIYLGSDAGGHGARVKSLVHDVSAMIQETYARSGFAQDSFPFPEPSEPLLSDPRWEALASMLEVPWFQRGWVVQESGLASMASILWGEVEMPWLSFMRTYYWVPRRGRQRSSLKVMSVIAGKLNDLYVDTFTSLHIAEAAAWQPTQGNNAVITTLPEILHSGRTLSLTDNRDRIYAFLALAQRVTPTSFVPRPPDYVHGHLTTYLEFASHYLPETNDLTLLNYVQHDAGTIADATPSWVPRWDLCLHDDTLTYPRHDTLLSSTADVPLPCTLVANEVLKVSGVIFDTVDLTSGKLTRDATMEEVGNIWQRFRPGSSSPYGTSPQASLAAFAQCLKSGMMRGTFQTWLPDFQAYLRQIHKFSGANNEVDPPNETAANPETVHSVVRSMIHNRAAVRTSRGYYALAPGLTRKGDVVAVLFGTRAPFVLRTDAARRGHYRVLGDAFVASKSTYSPRPAAGHRFNDMLGCPGAKDWENLGLSEEDISLV